MGLLVLGGNAYDALGSRAGERGHVWPRPGRSQAAGMMNMPREWEGGTVTSMSVRGQLRDDLDCLEMTTQVASGEGTRGAILTETLLSSSNHSLRQWN